MSEVRSDLSTWRCVIDVCVCVCGRPSRWVSSPWSENIMIVVDLMDLDVQTGAICRVLVPLAARIGDGGQERGASRQLGSIASPPLVMISTVYKEEKILY